MVAISSFLSEILKRRGLIQPEEQIKFLHADLSSLTPPFLIPQMQKACLRLLKAVERREKVFIYGDGDVDGLCSVALLWRLTEALELPCDFYLTHRLEEFEIAESLIENLVSEGYTLLLVADCGTSSWQALEKAASSGMDVIVLDHHLCGRADLPRQHIYLNPTMCDWPEGSRNLSSAGISFMFLQGMEALTPGLREKATCDLVELAGLGILGDGVVLKGDNRILVKEGLRRLSTTRVPGLRYFLENFGVAGEIKCRDVTFKINPRLNAPGRFGRPEVALKILLENREKDLPGLCRDIEEYDRKRSTIVVRAMKMLNQEPETNQLVVMRDFPPGLCGIIASRLVEKTGRPVLVCSRTGERIRGSGRSAGGFDLYWRLWKYREKFISLGGHSRAIGFTFAADRLEEIEEIWKEAISDFQPSTSLLVPEATLRLKDLTAETVAELSLLEPCGPGNPRPLFLEPEVTIQEIFFKGKNRFQFWVGTESSYFQCFLEKKEESDKVIPGKSVGLVYTPRISEATTLRKVWLDVKMVVPEKNKYGF